MPRGGRRSFKLTDLFTKDELSRVMELFIECRNTRESFNQRCTREVVEPIMSRLNAYEGCNATPASLVCRLAMYVKAVRGEERLTHH
jgi:hypothetical protein